MSDMALVLQGGGALGAYEYGAVTRLVELGWQPRAVSGVSIGAINAAAIAGSRPGEIVANLHRLWEAITLQDVPWLLPAQQAQLAVFGNPNFYRLRTDYDQALGWTSLCDVSPMYSTLARICDFDLINDAAHMRLAVTATNLRRGFLSVSTISASASARTSSSRRRRSGRGLLAIVLRSRVDFGLS